MKIHIRMCLCAAMCIHPDTRSTYMLCVVVLCGLAPLFCDARWGNGMRWGFLSPVLSIACLLFGNLTVLGSALTVPAYQDSVLLRGCRVGADKYRKTFFIVDDPSSGFQHRWVGTPPLVFSVRFGVVCGHLYASHGSLTPAQFSSTLQGVARCLGHCSVLVYLCVRGTRSGLQLCRCVSRGGDWLLKESQHCGQVQRSCGQGVG